MKKAQTTASSKKPLIAGLVVFFVLLVLTQYLSYQRQIISSDTEQREITNVAGSVKERLQNSLSHSFAATKTLAFIVERYGEPTDFDSVAKNLLTISKYIDAIQLVKGGEIIKTYPLKGNEAAIGLDILKDSLLRKEAFKAIEQNTLFFSGPFELKQGGLGVVGRQPIYRENKFWGFAAVIIRLPTLLNASGIGSEENKNFDFQLSKINPNTKQEEFFLPNPGKFNEGYFETVQVPDGEWNLYVKHRGKSKDFLFIALIVFGVLLSVLGGRFAWYFIRQPDKLSRLVGEKTMELHAIERNYRTTLARVSDAIIAVDTEWRYTFLNDAALKTHPEGREATLGKSIWDVHPEMMGTVFEEKYREAMVTEKVTELESYYPPMDTWFSVKVYPAIDGLTVIYKDITFTKRTEEQIVAMNEQLRSLSGHLQNIREEERTHVAREIHDDLGQQLTGLKFVLSALRTKNDKELHSDFLNENIYEMLAMVDTTIISVRRIAKELRPGVLDDLGLEAAIEWQAKEFEDRTNVKTTVVSTIDDQNFSKEINTAVFRIFQESLTNITRHSEATKVEVKLFIESGNLMLEIIDNGLGISEERKNNKSSLGLLGMNERATYLSGKFTIEKHHAGGTIVTVKIPLPL